MPDILTDETATYLASVEPPADELVREMEADAAENGIPIADRSVAALQAILALATNADRALEFGTATGYSALHVARTGTDVVTTEVDRERIDAAVEYLRRDGLDVSVTEDAATIDPEPSGDGTVTIIQAPALDTLPKLEEPFDLVFLDAVKNEYEAYLAGALPLMPEGGVVVADNLLSGGNVPASDAVTEDGAIPLVPAIQAFNDWFVTHERLRAVITPQGSGTGIGVKTG